MKVELKPDELLTKMPSLTALKAFVAAGRYKSFTGASQALCVTQSAISKQIRELEASLGVELFNRIGRSVEMTDAGKRLYETTYLSFSHINQTAKEIRKTDNKRKNKNRLTIAMTQAFSVLWMANNINDFSTLHPEIDLAIMAVEDVNSLANDSYIDGYLSLNPPKDDDHVSTALFSETISPVCNASYLEKNPDLVKNEALLNATLLHLRGSPAHHGFGWKQWFEFTLSDSEEYGAIEDLGLHASNYQFLIQMALDGHGVALGWGHLVENLVKQGKLVRPIKDEVKLENYRHCFSYNKKNEGNRDMQLFKHWLISCF